MKIVTVKIKTLKSNVSSNTWDTVFTCEIIKIIMKYQTSCTNFINQILLLM